MRECLGLQRSKPVETMGAVQKALRDLGHFNHQALSALLFLSREVLPGVELPWLDAVVRAKRPQHLPVVLTRDEVRAVLQQLDGVPRLMALLLYGAGLRLLECCRLRAGRCPSPGAWRPRTFTVGPTRDRCTS